SFFFDDPELTLIFRGDLLGSESQANVAARLVRLYREERDGFASRLRGTFAIILYDHNHQTLKAWTDHLGIESLIFAERHRAFAVGTKIESVLQIFPTPPVVSAAAIYEYLQYTCIPTPRTIYKDVFKLPPGHQLISRSSTTTLPFWDMVYSEQDESRRSEADWANETYNAVSSALTLSLQPPVEPFTPGCFLSGGTDSSSIAGLVGRVTEQPPHTFSIGFDDARYNEIQYARIAARHFSADYHEYFVKPEDIPILLQKAVRVYDEPFGNSSIVPTYYCARLATEY